MLPLGLSGAATRIRTGDLILTKDVLYQLSHSSITQGCFLVTQTIIPNIFVFVNTFFKKNENYFLRELSVITLLIKALLGKQISNKKRSAARADYASRILPTGQYTRILRLKNKLFDLRVEYAHTTDVVSCQARR